MGAGKTTAAGAIASATGAKFCDLDEFISHRQSASIDDIISSLGEPEFRRIETEALAALCARGGFCVVSTGGGVVISESNRAVMAQSGVVIYLKAKVETLMRRISQDAPRPLLKVDNPGAEAARLLSERERFYEAADFTIETDGMCPDEVASEAVRLLRAETDFEKIKGAFE